MIWSSQQLNQSLNTAASFSSSNDTTSNLVRLVEDQTIKKNIQFDELSTAYLDGKPDTQGGDQQVKTLGLEYPMIRINDAILNKQEILSMSISSKNFLPTISLSLQFTNTLFLNNSMPKDGDIISTFVRTNTAALQYLRNDFIITSCSSRLDSNTSTNYVNLTGKLFVPGFDSYNNTFGVIGTSKDALKEIAKQFHIGFAYNDSEDTNDFQNWVCCNNTAEYFVSDILDHTWKDEVSFFKAWIDLYYDLCFVNVNKFLLSDQNTEDEIDLTFSTQTFEAFDAISTNQSAEDSKLAMKIFSNTYDFKGTPFFIKEWSPVNNSAKISFNEGYDLVSYTFVHNQNLFTTNDSSCFEILSNVPAYDQNKTSSYILLRGRARYDSNQNPETEQARVNYDYINTYVKRNWAGIEYSIDSDETEKNSNNTWSGNVHPNFARAEFHNIINIKELDKLYLVITCDGLCLQVMRGERIPVFLVYNTPVDEAVTNQTNQDPGPNTINKFYSGYYIIDSISYNYEFKSNSVYSGFSTTMTLKRREWPAPEKTAKTNS